MGDIKNNWHSSNKFVGRCPGTIKNAQLFFIHRHLRDGQMQSVLVTSAAVSFQLDLCVKLGVFYCIILGTGKVYEEDCCNILIILHHCLTRQIQPTAYSGG